MKKIISMVLLVCMVSVLFVACNQNVTDNETTPAATTPSVPGVTTAPTETGRVVKDNTTADLGGDTYRILAWEDAYYLEFEYDVEDTSMKAVNDSIRDRNKTVTTNRNCNFEFVYVLGNYENREVYLNKALQLDAGSATDYIDIYAGYSQVTGLLSTKGLCANLMKYTGEDTLDFSYPWWPQSLIKDAVFDGRLYFCTGDIATSVLWWMSTIYFNKKMIETLGHDPLEPYKLVDNKQWTIDKLIEYCTDVAVNDDGVKDFDNDIFGFYSDFDVYFDALQVGCGFTMLDPDDTQLLKLSSSYASQAEGALHTKLREFLHGPDAFHKKGGGLINDKQKDSFMKGNSLFTIRNAAYAHDLRMSDLADFNYGILPVPMLNTAQGQYYTQITPEHTLYAIGFSSNKKEGAAAVLQSLAAESYIQVTPVIFDEAMKLRYSHEIDDARMFDTIKNSIRFEAGRYYNLSLDDYCWKTWRLNLGSNSAYLPPAQGAVRAISALITALANNLKNADK